MNKKALFVSFTLGSLSLYYNLTTSWSGEAAIRHRVNPNASLFGMIVGALVLAIIGYKITNWIFPRKPSPKVSAKSSE